RPRRLRSPPSLQPTNLREPPLQMLECPNRQLGGLRMHKRRCNRQSRQGEPVLRNPAPSSKLRTQHLRPPPPQRLATPDLPRVRPVRSTNHLFGYALPTNRAHCGSEMVRRPQKPAIDVRARLYILGI